MVYGPCVNHEIHNKVNLISSISNGKGKYLLFLLRVPLNY